MSRSQMFPHKGQGQKFFILVLGDEFYELHKTDEKDTFFAKNELLNSRGLLIANRRIADTTAYTHIFLARY